MKSLIERHRGRFARLFNSGEMSWAEEEAPVAVRFAFLFAAKEAVFKSLGINPVFFMRWRDIEILPRTTPSGVQLRNELKKRLTSEDEKIQTVWDRRGKYVFAVAVRKKNALVSD